MEGDLKGAIEEYKGIVSSAGSDRAAAARALLRMAEAYQKLGDAEAQKIYQRLVRDFGDQKDAAAAARARLTPTGEARSATVRNIDAKDASGTVSADGRFLAYMDWDTGNVAVRDLRSGAERPVTRRNDYNLLSPVISRDGKYVAYESFNGACVDQPQPHTRLHSVLCIVSIGDESGSARVALDRADISGITPMDWSPDGRAVAVSIQREDRAAQIGIVKVDNGSLDILQTVDWRGPTRIFFSPDGRHVAFDLPVNDTSDERDVHIVAVNGGGGVPVVQHAGQDIVMGWTPDGAHLLFASDRGGSMGLWAQRIVNSKPDGKARLVDASLGSGWSLGVTTAGSLYFAVQNIGRDVELVNVDLVSGKQTGASTSAISRYVGTNAMSPATFAKRFRRACSFRKPPSRVTTSPVLYHPGPNSDCGG